MARKQEDLERKLINLMNVSLNKIFLITLYYKCILLFNQNKGYIFIEKPIFYDKKRYYNLHKLFSYYIR